MSRPRFEERQQGLRLRPVAAIMNQQRNPGRKPSLRRAPKGGGSGLDLPLSGGAGEALCPAPLPWSDHEFQTLAENLPDAVVRYDRQLRCVYANPAVEACLDRPRSRMLGRTNGRLGLPRRLVTLWNDSLRLVFANGQPLSIEFSLPTSRGERFVEARIIPETDPPGRVDSALAIFHDVTERRRSERALLRKTEELQRTNAELEEFAYLASHDLKGPLRTAHALSSWIEEEVTDHLSDEGRERLTLMRARLQRMDELINATLQFSHAGAAIGDIEEVFPRRVIEEAIRTHGCPEPFSVSVSPRMPRLRTDPQLFGQVMSQLIGNAITHHDRPSGRVWVACREEGAFLEFSVVDDGPGIPPEYHERIFHMFQRGPEPGDGYGVGLAIVKKIVERIGGQIAVDSRPGWGTTFRVSWPKLLPGRP